MFKKILHVLSISYSESMFLIKEQLMGWVRMIEWWTRNNQAPIPSVVSGCVENYLQINYKNAVDTIFYKINFNLWSHTSHLLLSNTL